MPNPFDTYKPGQLDRIEAAACRRVAGEVMDRLRALAASGLTVGDLAWDRAADQRCWLLTRALELDRSAAEDEARALQVAG